MPCISIENCAGKQSLFNYCWVFISFGPIKMLSTAMRSYNFITSAEEGGHVFGSVCLSVCPLDYSKCSKRILLKFFGGWAPILPQFFTPLMHFQLDSNSLPVFARWRQYNTKGTEILTEVCAVPALLVYVFLVADAEQHDIYLPADGRGGWR